MATVTIELTDETRAMLEQQAACRGMTLSRLVAERVERLAVEQREVLAILDEARDNSGLDEDEAMAFALEEVHKHRSGQ